MRLHRCVGGYKANGGLCVRFVEDGPTEPMENYIKEGFSFGALRFECMVPRTLKIEQVAEVRAALRRISEEMDRVYDDRRDMFGARQVPGTGVQVEIIKDFLRAGESVERVAREFGIPRSVVEGYADSQSPSTITYPCKVGGGRVVDVTLPSDLTSSEMRRVCAMLMTQVDDDPDPVEVFDEHEPGDYELGGEG